MANNEANINSPSFNANPQLDDDDLTEQELRFHFYPNPLLQI